MKAFLPPNKDTPKETVAEGCDSDAISSSNYMPAPNQKRAEGQNKDLSLEREVSSIPRGGNTSEKYWVYPSEQMFFNSMRRKNWSPSEDDMASVVPIHNAVNEMCWRKILEWEAMHENQCGGPRLVKFQGKPRDYTPKARLRSLFGYTLPFDRHDWIVDRCGKQVRYVIDFYSGKPDPNSPSSVSFYLDVRPALSVEGVMDRIRRLFH
ncbi:cytochrome c and c1 heme-lyase [Basidiobolus meristosporus CBS 931.73]|uniref:Holocytochrome c-type synthase n=1 Tax=Basidiobolus meristosporus CBS 931.73 TaxID=1314790 RepID=A0A1Y1YCY7_9FUNG|nr:cytochrome c and c1 heme-lyase [Basidiobolus meristosporus CBS 931.73]|eukprot:ORX95852.1 cytochrome c and c1 heme-lyase [Basidiobolus meristosporus CBS 931.73]